MLLAALAIVLMASLLLWLSSAPRRPSSRDVKSPVVPLASPITVTSHPVIPDELANFSRLAEVNLGELQPPRTNDRGHVFMRSADGRWQTILDRQGRLLKVRHVTGENPQDEMSWKHKAAPEASLPWSEAQALAKTRSLLEGLGQRPVVARTEYEAEPWHVRNREGKPATTVPFHTVRFYDTNDILLIQAEYQAGPEKIKLIGWFNNLP